MNHLFEIVKALRSNEQQALYKELSTSDRFSKRKQLFEMVAFDKIREDHRIAQKLYGCPPHSAYSHLKARLVRQIHNFFIPQLTAIMVEDAPSPKQIAWRALLLGQFYLNRGAVAAAKEVVSAGRSRIREEELPGETLLLESLWLRCQAHLPDNPSRGKELNISAQANRLREHIEAKQTYLEIEQFFRLHNAFPKGLPARIAKVYQQVKQWVRFTSSPENQYWYLRILVLLESCQDQPEQAWKHLQELEELLTEPQAQFSAFQKNGVRLEKARIQYIRGQKGQSQEVLKNLVNNAVQQPIISVNSLEIGFLMACYEQKPLLAANYLTQGERRTRDLAHPFLMAKWSYYAAHLAYLGGQPKKSLQLLESCATLQKSKSKWAIGIKVLEIYNLLVLKELDLAEYRLEALRQLVKRQKAKGVERAKVICQVIGSYMRNSYCPTTTLEKNALVIDKYWRPFDFEVISLANWLKGQKDNPWRLQQPLQLGS